VGDAFGRGLTAFVVRFFFSAARIICILGEEEEARAMLFACGAPFFSSFSTLFLLVLARPLARGRSKSKGGGACTDERYTGYSMLC
jgi:hypothetical protein